MTETARALLQACSGKAAGATISPLTPTVMSPMHLAAENDVWLVRFSGGDCAVLRVLRADMSEDFDSEAMVAGALAAAAAEAGPRVIAYDAARGVLLLEYLGEGWRRATMWDLYDAGVRRRLLAAMERLHRAAPITHRFDPFERLTDAARRAKATGTPMPTDFDWLVDGAEQISAAMAAQPVEAVLCRNDGASSNIMLHESGRVLLLDYDEAGMNDPAYDLGALMTEGSMFEDEALTWLEGMAQPARRQMMLFRAQLHGAVGDLLCAARAARHAHTGERIHVEFRKYSEWRFMRARRVLADRRFEWMLRVVGGG